MRVGFTGHRPNKLWGYNIDHPSYWALRKYLVEYFISEKVTEAYVGMAIGFDVVVALAVIDCKAMGYDIKLIACIPCADQECKWSLEDQRRYWEIIYKTDKIFGVDEDGSEVQLVHMFLEENSYCFMTLDPGYYAVEYAPWRMQARNKIIVNHCDTLVALWDGTSGGTANCVNYAKQTGRVNIKRLNPKDFE